MRVLIVSLEHDCMREGAESPLISRIIRKAAEPHHAQVDITVVKYFGNGLSAVADNEEGSQQQQTHPFSSDSSDCPLKQYIYDPHTGYFDIRGKSKFAGFDAVIIAGQGKTHLAPWSEEMMPLNVFIRECMKSGKPILASGFAFLAVCYLCAMGKASVPYVGDCVTQVVNPTGDRISDILTGRLTYHKTNLSKPIVSSYGHERSSLQDSRSRSSLKEDEGRENDVSAQRGSVSDDTGEHDSTSGLARSRRLSPSFSLSRSMSTLIPTKQYVLDSGTGDLYPEAVAECLTLQGLVSQAVMNVGLHSTLTGREFTSGAHGRVLGNSAVALKNTNQKKNTASETPVRMRAASRQFVAMRSSECVCDVPTIHPATHSRAPLASEFLALGKFDNRSFTVPHKLEWECNEPAPYPLQVLGNSHSKGPVIVSAGSLLACAFPIDPKYPFTAHLFSSFMTTVANICRTGDVPVLRELSDVCYSVCRVPPITNLQKQMLTLHLAHCKRPDGKSQTTTVKSIGLPALIH